MDSNEFKIKGKDMVDYICDYMEQLKSRRVTPNIEPGYLRKLLPEEAPDKPEDWDSIMADVESKIMPGVTHWQHPRFHAYFPSGNSYPSILGDMLSNGISCIGFSWAASPALTELETIVLDWMGKAIGLPEEFLAFSEGSRGGGVIQAMEEDETMGLVPFFVSTTLGTTSCCSFDHLAEIGPVCQKFPCVWLHVDAAYAGNAFICPELKYLLSGIEYADSFNTNPNKWLLTNFDCSLMWVRDRIRLTSALVVDPLYLKHGYSDAAIDYRHWGVPLSRRFRSLKLWFVLRCYGISGLQKYIRHHIKLAKLFEQLVLKDHRFEICNEVKLGLVCFRLKGSDKLNEKLLSNINASGKIHMVPSHVNDKYVIRFCVVAQDATEADIDYAWAVVTEFAEELLESQAAEKEQELNDDVFELLARKKKETLAQKRSFFVRMVSDPKIYNPSIAKAAALPATRRHLTEAVESPNDNNVTIQPPLSASWISWPLAFLFQGMEDGAASDVPIRFRHLDTKVRLKAAGKGTNDRQSPSPEGENSRSPKRSPILYRKTDAPSNSEIH